MHEWKLIDWMHCVDGWMDKIIGQIFHFITGKYKEMHTKDIGVECLWSEHATCESCTSLCRMCI